MNNGDKMLAATLFQLILAFSPFKTLWVISWFIWLYMFIKFLVKGDD